MSDGRLDGGKAEFIAAVLAGGQGKRLGMDKATLQIGACSLLDKILATLRGMFPLILLVVQEAGSPLAAREDDEVKVVADVIPGKGPLVGIYTALRNSPAPYVFVMACDMPYPSRELICRMLSMAPGADAVVPKRGEYIEPLFAVYRRDIADSIQARIEEGRLKIHELIEELDVRYLEEDEIAACDPGFRSFFNINTPEDLEAAF
ncbi:MAG: molybdenum cofactor guanylyltransferase [Actinomycetota bacterium]|nr:molybdenum cofactor guanylyltransferase [Actinomycetota bacterium]MDD5665696.1 molybdenum cofactor guanylyltransferase [Actinomycetota bacterium]